MGSFRCVFKFVTKIGNICNTAVLFVCKMSRDVMCFHDDNLMSSHVIFYCQSVIVYRLAITI